MFAVDIHNLSKTYANGTRALIDIHLQIQKGDFFALLGANGAGKTTLIGILNSLVRKDCGQVQIFNHDIDQDFSWIKQRVGVVPQEMNLNIFEKTRDILITQAGYFGMTRKTAAQRSDHLLKTLGLWEKRAEVSRSLSGGMKRRLMIARALMHDPDLLILDEPTAGVDVELRHGMWDYLRKLNQRGKTILLTTHYLEEVEQMCRHAAMIKEGRVIECDAVSRLMGVLDEETYIFSVKEIRHLHELQAYGPQVMDRHSFQVTVRKDDLHRLMTAMQRTGMQMIDIRTQGHRLERLFLKLLKG